MNGRDKITLMIKARLVTRKDKEKLTSLPLSFRKITISYTRSAASYRRNG
jgi:hypothetical protein